MHVCFKCLHPFADFLECFSSFKICFVIVIIVLFVSPLRNHVILLPVPFSTPPPQKKTKRKMKILCCSESFVLCLKKVIILPSTVVLKTTGQFLLETYSDLSITLGWPLTCGLCLSAWWPLSSHQATLGPLPLSILSLNFSFKSRGALAPWCLRGTGAHPAKAYIHFTVFRAEEKGHFSSLICLWCDMFQSQSHQPCYGELNSLWWGSRHQGWREYHRRASRFMPHYTASRTDSLDWLGLPLAWHRLIGIYAFEWLSTFFLMWDYRNIQGVRGFCSSARVTVWKHTLNLQINSQT